MNNTVGVQGTIANGVTNRWWLYSYSALRPEEERKKADESEYKRVV